MGLVFLSAPPYMQEPPFAMVAPRDDDDTTDVNSDGAQRQYRGYLVDLLEALAKHASFTYSLYAVHDRQRGTRQPDGTWNGLVGELITGVSIESVSNWTAVFAWNRACFGLQRV